MNDPEEWKYYTPGYIFCEECGTSWFCHYEMFYGYSNICRECQNDLEWKPEDETDV